MPCFVFLLENLLTKVMEMSKLIPVPTELSLNAKWKDFCETDQPPVFLTCSTWKKAKVSRFQNIIIALWCRGLFLADPSLQRMRDPQGPVCPAGGGRGVLSVPVGGAFLAPLPGLLPRAAPRLGSPCAHYPFLVEPCWAGRY